VERKRVSVRYLADKDRYGVQPYRLCGVSGLVLPAVSLGFWHDFGDEAGVRRLTTSEVFTPELAAGWREVMHTLPFSEHRIKITDMVAEGGQVAIRVESRGVHSGEWEGVPPLGSRGPICGMGLERVEDGKIIELEFIFDELGHLKQPGATISARPGLD
jgi:hypothetical protein